MRQLPKLLCGLMALLCISLSLGASGQQQQPAKEWTWKDRDGYVRSRADLDKILAEHKLWLHSNKESGTQANLSGADMTRADLSGADLFGAQMNGAELKEADLVRTLLNFADMSAAHLNHAALGLAHMVGTDLRGAEMYDAGLIGAVFEPRDLPKLQWIALAHGLEMMTYDSDPGPLTKLRKQFQDAGYREQERAITCALNRREAELASPVECWFKRVVFDFTCQYGFAPGRPLRIVCWLWLLFSAVYAVFMHWPGPSGIYFIGSRQWRGRTNTQGIQIRPRAIRAAKWWKLSFLWLRREWRVLRAAMFFSLMSAFNIGFRDINFGRWLRLLTRREYDLKAVGWARTVAGFQSLLSVYLIALWVLTYFGRPFGQMASLCGEGLLTSIRCISHVVRARLQSCHKRASRAIAAPLGPEEACLSG